VDELDFPRRALHGGDPVDEIGLVGVGRIAGKLMDAGADIAAPVVEINVGPRPKALYSPDPRKA